MPAKRSLKGNKHGMLFVISEAYISDKKDQWLCICDCGGSKIADGRNLKAGKILSCGCLGRGAANYRHGNALSSGPTPEYRAWCRMKERCYSHKNKSYKDYGGRGIIICNEWINSFEMFLDHIGQKPSKEHSLERIDNNKSYEPGNVKWATRFEQANNTRKNVLLTYNGETKTISQWGRHTGIDPETLQRRLSLGWTGNDVIEKPLRDHKPYKTNKNGLATV